MKVTEVQHDPTYTLELNQTEVSLIIGALTRHPSAEATEMAGEIQVVVWGPPPLPDGPKKEIPVLRNEDHP